MKTQTEVKNEQKLKKVIEDLCEKDLDEPMSTAILKACPEVFPRTLEEIRVARSTSDAWSDVLEAAYGPIVPLYYAVGSELLIDQISDCLNEPENGCVPAPPAFPQRFSDQYTPAFIQKMLDTLTDMRERAMRGDDPVARSVAEEVLYCCCVEEAEGYYTDIRPAVLEELEKMEGYSGVEDWPQNMFDDDDVHLYCYSDTFPISGIPQHYCPDHWFDQVFFLDGAE